MKKIGPWSFYKQALAIAVPVILQTFLLNLVSLVDNFMVAGLGDSRMAGVNIANQLTFVYLVLLGTIAGAGGIFLAQYNGAQNPHGMQMAYRFKVVFSVVSTILFFLVCQFLPETMISWMTLGNSAQAELVLHGSSYLRTVSWSFLPLAWVSAAASSLRDIGKPRPPLIFSVIAALINTGLNFLLIEGNLGAPRLEVVGAAYATIVARSMEAVLLAIYMAKTKPDFLVNLRRMLHIDPVILKAIVQRSWMMLVSEITWVLCETVTAAVYNGRGGADLVAGLAAGWTIANLFFSVFGGLYVSAAVLIGSELGADRKDAARERARWLLNGSWFIGLAFAVLQIASLLLVPVVFGNLSDEARTVSYELIAVIAVYLPMWVFINAQFAVSRAGGDVVMGFVVDMIVNFGVFIPLVFLLANLTPWPAVLLFAVVKLSDFAKLAIAAWWLKKERWVKNLTVEAT